MLKVSGDVPDEILVKLKDGPANHIQRNSFRYKMLIDKELFALKRVKDIKAGALSMVSGTIVAIMIGIFNSLFAYLFEVIFSAPDDGAVVETNVTG